MLPQPSLRPEDEMIQILNKKQPTNQLMNSFVSKQNWPSPQGLSLASIALAFAMPRLPFFGLGT